MNNAKAAIRMRRQVTTTRPNASLSIWHGAKVNLRVIVALIFREAAQRFGDGPFSYAWTLVEPSILLGVMLVMRIYIKNYTAAFGDSSVLFLLTGLLAFRMIRSTINTSGRAIVANRPIFGFGVIKPPDTVIAKTVVEFTIWMVILMLFFAGTSYVLGQKVITNFQGFVLALCYVFFFCLAMSLFNATVGALFPFWRFVWKIMTMPLLLLSGVVYVPALMPPDIISIIVWNPLLHCIEGLRAASYIDYISLYDPVYLNVVSLIILLISLAIERLFRKRIIKSKDDIVEEEEELI